ncbi:outer membrane protein transport protein [Vibrio sp.]|nr:outer membrane protein transport protein [Vibrio sp.]
MNKRHQLNKTLLALSIGVASGLVSQQSMAAGFQLNAQSATGIGRAFAGDAVIADNASVMARNPAAMSLFDKKALSLGFEVLETKIEVKDATYTGLLNNEYALEDSDSIGDTSIAPNLHFIMPLNDKISLGANIYSNFGTKTEFEDDYIATEYGGITDLKTLNFGFSGSYRLNEKLSLGAGVDLIYAQGTIKRELTTITESSLVNVDEADGWGVGLNTGLVYEVSDNHRYGLSYRYSPEITAEDDAGQEVTIALPDMAEFSGYHRLDNSKFAFHYSIQWIKWSEFENLEFDSLDVTQSVLGAGDGSYDKAYQWQDGWHYSIGTTMYLNEKWTLRAGYMYDTSAQDELKSISVPDSDRQWFSSGFSYQLSKASSIDFGFTYLMGEDQDVTEETQIGAASTRVIATTRADAILYGLQYNREF